VQVRERLDGSGYPRGLSGGAIPMLARVLGAADVYASMREPRPYRPARSGQMRGCRLLAWVVRGYWQGRALPWQAAWHRPGNRAPVASQHGFPAQMSEPRLSRDS